MQDEELLPCKELQVGEGHCGGLEVVDEGKQQQAPSELILKIQNLKNI